MAVNPESALRQSEPTGSPVEMLVVGCPLAVADGYANALRNQDQAAHLKIAPDLELDLSREWPFTAKLTPPG